MIYRAIYDGPPRWYTATRTRKLYVMVHATANTASAEAEASYAKRRPSRVSSHYYVDDDSIVQSLDTDYRAWHAGNDEGNDHAIAYELTARNMNVGRAWWLDLANIEWPLFAGQVAKDCREHGITPRDLTVQQLRAGDRTGFCMHYEGNQAWGGSDHTDPGPNFPMDHLVRQVRALLEEDDVSAKDVWGYDLENVRDKAPKNASTMLRYTNHYAYTAAARAGELLAGQTAIIAAVNGQDPTEAFRAELTRHRGELLAELRGELAELVEAAQSGEREAGEVVDEIARRLAGDNEPA